MENDIEPILQRYLVADRSLKRGGTVREVDEHDVEQAIAQEYLAASFQNDCPLSLVCGQSFSARIARFLRPGDPSTMLGGKLVVEHCARRMPVWYKDGDYIGSKGFIPDDEAWLYHGSIETVDAPMSMHARIVWPSEAVRKDATEHRGNTRVLHAS